jgi:hypothetical protein
MKVRHGAATVSAVDILREQLLVDVRAEVCGQLVSAAVARRSDALARGIETNSDRA